MSFAMRSRLIAAPGHISQSDDARHDRCALIATLNTKYGRYFAARYFRGQASEARTIDQTRTRTPQTVIHDDDALDTQRAGSIQETELEASALLVVGLVWSTYKSRKYRRLWHTPEGATATSV
jgi:hypothetical protein